MVMPSVSKASMSSAVVRSMSISMSMSASMAWKPAAGWTLLTSMVLSALSEFSRQRGAG